jgi:hypothetical protein
MKWGRGAVAVACIAASIVTTGCVDSPSAATAASLDVSEARVNGQHEVDRVRREASERYRKASREVAEARRRAHHATIAGEREIALAQARADFDVATRGCEALGGEPRRTCRTRAEQRFDSARELAARIDYAYLD